MYHLRIISKLIHDVSGMFKGEVVGHETAARFAAEVFERASKIYSEMSIRESAYQFENGRELVMSLQINDSRVKFLTIKYDMISASLTVTEGLIGADGRLIGGPAPTPTSRTEYMWVGEHPYLPSIVAMMPHSWHPSVEPSSDWEFTRVIPLNVNGAGVNELTDKICQAVLNDETKHGGCDISAGMFGPEFSELVVQLAAQTSSDSAGPVRSAGRRHRREELASILNCRADWLTITQRVKAAVDECTHRTVQASMLRQQFRNVALRNGFLSHEILTDEDTRDQKFADPSLEQFYRGYLAAMAWSPSNEH